MEQANQKHNLSSEVEADDAISNMPDNVISHIIDLLPIHDAVRTSILSKSFRFKWTLRTVLVFNCNFFDPGLQGKINSNEKIISRILHCLKGSVTKFVLKLPKCKMLDDEDFSIQARVDKQGRLSKRRQAKVSSKNGKQSTSARDGKQESSSKRRKARTSSKSRQARVDKKETDGKQETAIDEKAENTVKEMHELEKTRKERGRGAGEVQEPSHLRIHNVCDHLYGGVMLWEPKPQTVITTRWPIRYDQTARDKMKTMGSVLSSLDAMRVECSMILKAKNARLLINDDVPTPLHYEVDSYTSKNLKLERVIFSGFRGSEAEVSLIKGILACSPLLKRIDICPNASQMFGGDYGKLMFATNFITYMEPHP
ncbi:F-box/FBD/LRR-repeat protein-like protein [Tanacetum coccineum]